MTVKIVCHMISSVDGRLYPSRWSEPAEPVDVTAVYENTAANLHGDGWIVGRTTMTSYADCVRSKEPAPKRTAEDAAIEPWRGLSFEDHGKKLIAVVYDPKGKLRFTDNILPTGEHLVVALPADVADSHLEALRKAGVSYVFSGKDGLNIDEALDQIEALFGVKTLLLEGGGIINGAFLKARRIDELSVLVYPAIDGLAGVSSIISHPSNNPDETPAAWSHLALLHCEVLAGGVVWIRYALKK